MFDQGTLAAPKGIDPPLLGANPTLADSNATNPKLYQTNVESLEWMGCLVHQDVHV